VRSGTLFFCQCQKHAARDALITLLHTTVCAGPTGTRLRWSARSSPPGNFVSKDVLHPYKSIPGILMQKHVEREKIVFFASNNGAHIPLFVARTTRPLPRLLPSWLRARSRAAEEDERRKQDGGARARGDAEAPSRSYSMDSTSFLLSL
jgi:hypothetical protein